MQVICDMKLFTYMWIIPSSSFIKQFAKELRVTSAFKQEMEFCIIDFCRDEVSGYGFCIVPWESHMVISEG